MSDVDLLIQTARRLSFFVLTCIIVIIGAVTFQVGVALGWFLYGGPLLHIGKHDERSSAVHKTWQPPDLSSLADEREGELILYGRELIEHTSIYLGPQGKINSISNGMNCQNCHLEGGTKPFAANYSAMTSTYPKYRKRSGMIEGFEKRVNDCIERSLNGSKIDENSREMKAIVSYLKWVSKDVAHGVKPEGHGLRQIPFLDRAADPVTGKAVYDQFCARCHGANGEGAKADNNVEWKYPPLWGVHSYNTGAGLFRLSKFAAFVKANMPYGISFENPLLTDEEAWDVAAYVNSMPRPRKEFAGDWPKLADKPVDYPFGPYADDFGEVQHKYGPFGHMLSGATN